MATASAVIRPRALGGRVVSIEATERGVARIEIGGRRRAPERRGRNTAGPSTRATAIAARAAAELEAYFEGRGRRFSTPLDLERAGTRFQRRVWKNLIAIPYGATASYGEVAARVGSAGAVRAVGQAVGRNPVPVIVPCHRVVGSDGQLTGFGCGLDVKVRLLEIEGLRLGPRAATPAQRRVARAAGARANQVARR
jgi:methylated-DNA-[protein]-cysteine S-methyltransferase